MARMTVEEILIRSKQIAAQERTAGSYDTCGRYCLRCIVSEAKGELEEEAWAPLKAGEYLRRSFVQIANYNRVLPEDRPLVLAMRLVAQFPEPPDLATAEAVLEQVFEMHMVMKQTLKASQS
jgi:hypothetical protein